MEKAWVVTSEAEVEAALSNADLHTRPRERVPDAMRGTFLGTVYARLARINDGGDHIRLRSLVERLIGSWGDEEIERIVHEATATVGPRDIAGYTVAVLLGVRDPHSAMPLIADFAAGVAAGASDEAVTRAIAAAEPLAQRLPAMRDADEAANALGLLFQTYTATAMLIERRLRGEPPPTLITRRYAARSLEFCGARLQTDDLLVLVLSPPRFQFGGGHHACPGRRVAELIARTAVQAYASTAPAPTR